MIEGIIILLVVAAVADLLGRRRISGAALTGARALAILLVLLAPVILGIAAIA